MFGAAHSVRNTAGVSLTHLTLLLQNKQKRKHSKKTAGGSKTQQDAGAMGGQLPASGGSRFALCLPLTPEAQVCRIRKHDITYGMLYKPVASH